MIQLESFEGITGYRWSAHIARSGAIGFSSSAPNVHERKVALIEQVLANAPFDLGSADLIFASGKVLLRRGPWGLLLLFCDPNVNVSMVDIVINEAKNNLATESNNAPGTTSSGTRLSLIHNLSDSSAPIPGDILAELFDIYVEFLGPFARRLAEKDLKENGIDSRQIPAQQWSNVLNILSERFNDDNKRSNFLDRAVMLKAKF